jgi:hypothetical protein
MADGWHRRIYAGVASVPSAAYVGHIRGSPHPDLVDYEVVLADRRTGAITASGVPAVHVTAELGAFESSLRLAVARLDGELGAGERPSTSEQVFAVVQLCALVHGEWVRIHPYANGNGRTARVWANWVALRYGLPPFVRIKPRPDGLLYGLAAHRSMGVGGAVPDHDLTFSVCVDLLRSQPCDLQR